MRKGAATRPGPRARMQQTSVRGGIQHRPMTKCPAHWQPAGYTTRQRPPTCPGPTTTSASRSSLSPTSQKKAALAMSALNSADHWVGGNSRLGVGGRVGCGWLQGWFCRRECWRHARRPRRPIRPGDSRLGYGSGGGVDVVVE